MTKTEQYIRKNWDNTIKTCSMDEGTLIALPKPYTVPCISGRFQEMYYWDTYFTNIGLILSGYLEQAKNNVDNMLYLVHRYGKMPNGNRTYYLNRSQPPFLSQMVREIYDLTSDKEWLRTAVYAELKTEYDFWQTQRGCENGLNRYGGKEIDEETLYREVENYCRRKGEEPPDTRQEVYKCGRAMYAIAESGWDCSSRYEKGADAYNPVDLNALLYMLESNMEYFAGELGENGEAESWKRRKEIRKNKMTSLMWNENRGCFCDYMYKESQVSDLFSAAAFYPLYAKCCDAKEAADTVAKLPLIEMKYGIAGCEKKEGLSELQWDYPNGWACLQYIVVKGLENYGYLKEAVRIAEKFIRLTDENFEKTGNLWEKYNVVTGKVSVTKEYATPPMMGWTAGIYMYFSDFLKKHVESSESDFGIKK